jgi:hypothetical protein
VRELPNEPAISFCQLGLTSGGRVEFCCSEISHVLVNMLWICRSLFFFLPKLGRTLNQRK